MELYPRLKRFILIPVNGNKIKKNIEFIHILENFIMYSGIHNIKKIIFDFYIYPSTYFPYGAHNIVLENNRYNNHFNIIFYHYYNSYNQRIDIPIQQHHYDFNALLNYLNYNTILYCYLTTHITNPFYMENKINETEIEDDINCKSYQIVQSF